MISTQRLPVSVPARFEVSEWRAFEKNTLRGFLSITTPSGLVINGVSLHEKGGKRWLSMPAKPWKKADGVTTWTPVVEFSTRSAHDRFQSEALRAVDAYLKGGRR
jgi:hypothetical protein